MGKKRIDASDDGRVVAPMNVDGMPWYMSRRAPAGRTQETIPGQAPREAGDSAGSPEEMTRRESMAFAFGVLKAVLLVAIALIGGYFAFIWFCVNIWLR